MIAENNSLSMPKLFLLFSHQLTPEQTKDAFHRFSIRESDIYPLPSDLKQLWSQVPPDSQLQMKDYLAPILTWLLAHSQERDYMLIQGEPGAVNYLIQFSWKNQLRPIYATTKRIISEKKLPDGSIKKTSVFKHIAFRDYERLT